MDSSPESLLRYFRSLFSESDRGCVLLVASRLDESLEELHRAYVNLRASPSDKLLDILFRPHGPLSTFAARIQLGHAYGLIPREVYDDCERLRKLRNDAAHSCNEFSFTSATVRDRILELRAPKRVADQFPGFALTEEERRAVEAPDNSEVTTKMYFVLTGMCLSIEMLVTMTRILQCNLEKFKPEGNQ